MRQQDDCNGKFVLCFASVAEYRAAALDHLRHGLGDTFVVYAGGLPDQAGVRLVDVGGRDYFFPVRNVYGPRNILVQFNYPWRALWRAECVVLDLNPRVLNVWVLTLARAMRGRRTLLWGHGLPRAGAVARSRWIRDFLVRLSSGAICYTPDDARDLAWRTGKSAWAAPNALYPAARLAFRTGTSRRTLLFVGRLVPEKRPDLFVRAFAKARREIPDARALIVGDGPLKHELDEMIRALHLESCIDFVGWVPVADVDQLEARYAEAFATCLPGEAGLTLTQSFGFGVPAIVAQGLKHGPEYALVSENENAWSFEPGDADSLAAAIVAAYSDRARLESIGPRISDAVRRVYTTEKMANGIARALSGQR